MNGPLSFIESNLEKTHLISSSDTNASASPQTTKPDNKNKNTQKEPQPGLPIFPKIFSSLGSSASDKPPEYQAIDISSETNINSNTGSNFSKSTLDHMISLRSPMARDWIARQRESVRPWNLFFDQEKFSKPTTPNEITLRLTKNVKYFQANYWFVFWGQMIQDPYDQDIFSIGAHLLTPSPHLLLVLILAGYCLITSPLLLIAIGAFFGSQYIIGGQQGIAYQQKIFGRELTETHQTIIASCISVPLFILAGATSAIFWVFGASVILVGAHGGLRIPEVDPEEDGTFLQETA